MKIAIVSFGHVAPIVMLAKHLSKRINVDLYLLLSQTFKKTSILNFEGTEVDSGLLNDEQTSRIIDNKLKDYINNGFKLKIFIYNSSRMYSHKNLRRAYEFSQIVKKHDYDLINFNGNNVSQLVISLFTPRIPKVHTIHDYRGHAGERKLSAELFNKYLMFTKRHKIFRSRWCAALAKTKLSDSGLMNIIPFSVLHIYKSWEKFAQPEEANTILFFGRVSPYKGIEYLIRAVPHIKKQITDLKVILAGEGEYCFDITRLANDNTYRVINRFLSNTELVELIQKSSIVVCPYTDATQSAVVMTAYAFNKPVVATSVGGLPEIVKDRVTGLLVPPRSPEKLAAAITELLEDAEKKRAIAANIRDNFSTGAFDWSNIASATIALYRKAILQQQQANTADCLLRKMKDYS